MNVLSLFSIAVWAAETIISPIPADGVVVVHKPIRSFGQLAGSSSPPAVMGEHTEPTPTATPMPSPSVTPTPSPTHSPTPTPAPTRKPSPTPTPSPGADTGRKTDTPVTPLSTGRSHYRIAVLGDSMVDTLGPGVPHLQDALKQQFPRTSFTILNYGVGATNIEYGLHRLTHDYTYLEQPIPSLISQNPDIVIVESFGYNPFPYDEGALDKHWLSMATAADTIRQQLPQAKIVFAATVAPNARLFGDGAPGLSFSAEDKQKRVSNIKRYIESTVKFATSQKYPLADAYHPSLQADGNGNPSYINPGDHIHPSDEGKRLFAREVVRTLVKHDLLR